MKTFKLFTLGTIAVCFIQACGGKAKTETVENMGRGCVDIYELNVLDNSDTINRTYGDGTKEGHWITFEWTDPNEKMVNENKENLAKAGRAKIEEGYYKDNKKEGFWKFFNKDGTLKDSVEYKNDLLVRS